MPVSSNWLLGQLEAEYPPAPIETLPHADVAIVLGGSIGQPLPPRITPDLSDAADRVLYAARLFRAGKVDRILVSGGNLPWQAGVKCCTAPTDIVTLTYILSCGIFDG